MVVTNVSLFRSHIVHLGKTKMQLMTFEVCLTERRIKATLSMGKRKSTILHGNWVFSYSKSHPALPQVALYSRIIRNLASQMCIWQSDLRFFIWSSVLGQGTVSSHTLGRLWILDIQLTNPYPEDLPGRGCQFLSVQIQEGHKVPPDLIHWRLYCDLIGKSPWQQSLTKSGSSLGNTGGPSPFPHRWE
jgi:hypothetical protein